MSTIRGLGRLGWLGFARIVRSRRTVVLGVLAAFAGAAVWLGPNMARFVSEGRAPATWAFEDFTRWVVRSLFGVLGPLVALAYGTAAIGDEREAGTLHYLLLRPLPRGGIYATRLAGALAATLLVGGMTFALLCLLAGDDGRRALALYWQPIALGLVAHASLFALFGVFFRHATILALAYAFFVEAFIGNMPGIIQRLSISYYIRSAVFELGAVRSENPLFVAIGPGAAAMVLAVASVAFALLGWWGFRSREYAPAVA